MKVIELFAGVGSQAMALKRLGVKHEIVAICEWDKYAYKSYEAIHGSTLNFGDITKVEHLPQCDLLTYSFPCQDISVAGKQRGFEKGSCTRSGLLWEVERLLFDYDQRGDLPKYLLLENVKNLVGKQNKPNFDSWLKTLEALGYNNYWKVLNAKHYGVPQNRERVFVVSILKSKDNNVFEWPVEFDNGVRLKDVLESNVDEKYYISDEKCARLISQIKETGKANTNPSGNGMNGNVYNGEYSPTLTTNKGEGLKVVIPCITPDRVEKRQNGRRFKNDGEPSFTITTQDRHGVLVKEATKQGYAIANEGDYINLEHPNSKTRRGRVGVGVAQTLTTSCNQAVVEPNEINVVGYLSDGYKEVNYVLNKNGIAKCLSTMQGGHREPKVLESYRIRKLTPKECWRLMGFSDSDFDKATQVNSNSQLYKQAGNSIVADVLYYIFKAMMVNETGEKKEPIDPTCAPGQINIYDLLKST